MSLLTADNFSKGMLIDDECMGGVTTDPQIPGFYAAFIVAHQTGETLGYHQFDSLDDALTAINSIPRQWHYEATGGCSQGNCKGGNCGKSGGGCGKKKSDQSAGCGC